MSLDEHDVMKRRAQMAMADVDHEATLELLQQHANDREWLETFLDIASRGFARGGLLEQLLEVTDEHEQA